MLTSDEYFATLAELRRDELVVCALGTTCDQWWKHTGGSKEAFYMHGAMGYSSSLALGLALGAPEQQVWMLNTDGAVVMNLGGLVTEAAVQPPNLLHLVYDNHCYECLGREPIVNDGTTDYAAVARAAGVKNAYRVASPDELRSRVLECREQQEYTLVVADVTLDTVEDETGFEPPTVLPYEGSEIKYTFGRMVEERIGRPVFGPQGC